MNGQQRSIRGRRWMAGVALAACGAVVAVTGGAASAAPASVNGHFEVETSTGPECPSPVGVCLDGTVSGRIKGAFSVVATSVTATADVATTGAVFVTGDAVVATGSGDLLCKLAGTLQVSADGPFVSLCVITGGTGDWAGASGYLRTSGAITLADGGSGSYDGKVTAP